MSVVNPDHLLDQAQRLASAAGVGAPRQADLRRAISAAYYALFHEIAVSVADILVGKAQRRSPRFALVYRSVAHRALRELCEDAVKQELPSKYAKYAPKSGFGADLIAVADAVVELQEKRHLADYDPMFSVKTSDTLLAIRTSRSAVSRLRRAATQPRAIFLSLIVFKPRAS